MLVTQSSLSPIEARVVRLAALSPRERRSRTGAFGRRAQSALDSFTGHRGPRGLADPRLEALRDQAVALREGDALIQPRFVAAGFTLADGAEVSRLVRATQRHTTPAARRDRAAYAAGLTLALTAMAGFIGLTASLMVTV